MELHDLTNSVMLFLRQPLAVGSSRRSINAAHERGSGLVSSCRLMEPQNGYGQARSGDQEDVNDLKRFKVGERPIVEWPGARLNQDQGVWVCGRTDGLARPPRLLLIGLHC